MQNLVAGMVSYAYFFVPVQFDRSIGRSSRSIKGAKNGI